MSNILRQRLEAGQSVYADHPSADTLAAFIEHGLKGSERDNVLSHLSTCSECRQSVLLAVPEGARPAQSLAPRSSGYFPAAMRWASVAAAVAVAIGVGMISYEHEFGPRSSDTSAVGPQRISTAQREVADEQTSKTGAAPKPQTTLQDSLSKDQPKHAGLREPQISELKKTTPPATPSRRDADKAKALELDQEAEASNVSPSALGIVSAQAQSTGKNEAGLTKQQNPASANFVSGGPIQQPQLNSRNEGF